MKGLEIAKKLASFAHRNRYMIDGWRFKNVVLGLVFIAEADPETFQIILDDLFGESDKPPRFDTVRRLVETEITYGEYEWVNDFINWDWCFEFCTEEETDKILVNLIDEIDLLLSENDLDIGNLYQLLIDEYGSLGGKAWGEFYTPSSVVELLHQLHQVERPDWYSYIPTVYDPACGCGNLFLAFGKKPCHFYGQDINQTALFVCKMNLILNGYKDCQKNMIRGDTMIHDKHKGIKADVAVLNPPFNLKWDARLSMDFEDFKNYGGYPPNGMADIGFLQRGVAKLKDDGVGFCIFYPQVLTRKGSERLIREHLIKNRYIRCVIDLPTGLFLTTSIATSLVIFGKEPSDRILFINAMDFGKKVQLGRILTTGEINTLKEHYEAFRRDPEAYMGVKGFSANLDLNHPEIPEKMDLCLWSLSPVDHLDLTDEEVFDLNDKKNLNRKKTRFIEKRYPSREMYAE